MNTARQNKLDQGAKPASKERPIAGDGMTRADSPGLAAKVGAERDPMEADDSKPKKKLPPPPEGDLSM